MTISIISLPKEVVIPDAWQQTPERKDRVDQVAQTIFTSWKDEQLIRFSSLLTVGTVALVGGIGISVAFLSIPGIVLCGAGLIVCLIKSQAIRREQVLRCQDACLKLEDWLIQFKKAAEGLHPSLATLVKMDVPSAIISKESCQDLLDKLNAFPENTVKDLAQALEVQHRNLFGENRRIGNSHWSLKWIDKYIQSTSYYGALVYFYSHVEHLKKCLRESMQEDSPQKKKFLFDAQHILRNEYFASFIQNPEFRRANVAAFRSSFAY